MAKSLRKLVVALPALILLLFPVNTALAYPVTTRLCNLNETNFSETWLADVKSRMASAGQTAGLTDPAYRYVFGKALGVATNYSLISIPQGGTVSAIQVGAGNNFQINTSGLTGGQFIVYEYNPSGFFVSSTASSGVQYMTEVCGYTTNLGLTYSSGHATDTVASEFPYSNGVTLGTMTFRPDPTPTPPSTEPTAIQLLSVGIAFGLMFLFVSAFRYRSAE